MNELIFQDPLLKTTNDDLSKYDNHHSLIPYLTNFSPLITNVTDKYSVNRRKDINERYLVQYFDFKRQLNNLSHRHGSMVSNSDISSSNINYGGTTSVNHESVTNSSTLQNTNNAGSPNSSFERYRFRLLVDSFLNNREDRIDPYQLQTILTDNHLQLNMHNSERDEEDKIDPLDVLTKVKELNTYTSDKSFMKHIANYGLTSDVRRAMWDEIDTEQLEHINDFIKRNFTNSFRKYYKKLLSVDLQEFDFLKSHNLWVPTIRDDCRHLLVGTIDDNKDLYADKTCPLFIKGLDYIPSIYDSYGGCSVLRSVFSEFKFPVLMYHCTIDINKKIYMMGGLTPCYKCDEEGPDLGKFYIDGIKNLPPPLLPNIINNPGMINNPFMYVYDYSSCALTKADVTGDIPPPLLCMTASKLTDNHIFYYGGFEIKTTLVRDEGGTFYLKERAFLNNTAYVFDTIKLHFTKIEITTHQYQNSDYSTIVPCFGHMQISTLHSIAHDNVNMNDSNTSIDSTILANTKLPQTKLKAPTSKLTENASISSNQEEALRARSMSPRESKNRLNNNNGNLNHGIPIATIIIFGGYKQTGDNKYEAMNDMWAIHVRVVGRGKGNYVQFADTAMASNLRTNNNKDNWPSKRAFFGYDLPKACLFNEIELETKLLKDLENNFKIEYEDERKSVEMVDMKVSGSESIKNGNDNKSLHSANSMSRKDNITNNSNYSNNTELSEMQRHIKLFNVLKRTKNSISLVNESNMPIGNTITIHGGSDNKKIFGDMWWFNLSKLEWKKYETYNNRGPLNDGLGPFRLKLVGHNMNSIGHMSILTGGMNEKVVNELYSVEGNETTSEKHRMEASKIEMNNDFSQDSMINVLNLSTQCYQNISKCQEQHSSLGLTSRAILSVGSCTVESNGIVYFIGGVALKRNNLYKPYLRGALLEFVLPNLSLNG